MIPLNDSIDKGAFVTKGLYTFDYIISATDTMARGPVYNSVSVVEKTRNPLLDAVERVVRDGLDEE